MTYETTPKSNKKSSFLADFTLVLQLCLNRRSHKVFLAPQFKCVWDDFYFCTGTNPRYKPKVSSPLHIVHGGRFIMGWSRQRISAALQPNFQLGWVAEQALGTIHCVKTQLTFRLRHFLLSYLGNINYFLEEKNTNLKKKKSSSMTVLLTFCIGILMKGLTIDFSDYQVIFLSVRWQHQTCSDLVQFTFLHSV